MQKNIKKRLFYVKNRSFLRNYPVFAFQNPAFRLRLHTRLPIDFPYGKFWNTKKAVRLGLMVAPDVAKRNLGNL